MRCIALVYCSLLWRCGLYSALHEYKQSHLFSKLLAMGLN